MKRRDFVARAALLAAPAMVQAQAVSNWAGARPVRIIHPFQAGGVA
jgi:tripartite-type tricarboxylate transporter receptor subunit TctC